MKHPATIAIEDFTYELPPEKIAAYPLASREASKLLVYKDHNISETVFNQVGNYLDANSLLVFNNTRVIQARLGFLSASKKPIEIFCLEPAYNRDVALTMAAQQSAIWNCLAGNLKQWKEESLLLEKDKLQLKATLLEKHGTHITVAFSWEPAALSFAEVLDLAGAMPIPPYLKRESEEIDLLRYQTVYARHKGSVAAPTAGLHFTQEILDTLAQQSVQRLEVTLHVGAGTFKPVKSSTMQGHEMHAEWIEVSTETLAALLNNLSKNIIAVGTTSLRTLESLYWMGVKAIQDPGAGMDAVEVKQWDPYQEQAELPGAAESITALLKLAERLGLKNIVCKTGILIAPPYQLRIASGLITNFHQPQSTLLLIVSAITGADWRRIYQYALDHQFRFLSYGDSSLLLK